MTLDNEKLSEHLDFLIAQEAAVATRLETLKQLRNPATGVVLCNIRDEIAFLPHFLKHYRAIGIERFAFVDNGSVDGSVPYLLDQPDCDVYRFIGEFRELAAGMIWKNILMTRYRGAPWFFSVDADEHAVYDGWPEASLDEVAVKMNCAGFTAVTAIMVDMYGPGPVLKTAAGPQDDLHASMPLFDGVGYVVSLPADWRATGYPRPQIWGGPEMRLNGEEERGWLSKTPLVLEPGIRFRDPHGVVPVGLNLVAPRIALLHFRFCAEVLGKIARIAARGSHAASSRARYRCLGERLCQEPDFSFAWEGSTRFESPQQFIDRGMIQPIVNGGLR
jgi:hypothetical protein